MLSKLMRVIGSQAFSYFIICLLGITSLNCTSETLEKDKALSPPKHDVYVVAHRGAHIGIPENTLAAYEAAIAMGVDFVEVDLRTTQDGYIVGIHNKDIDSYVINGEKGLVSEITLEQLKQLDIGSRISPRWRNQRIPTFEEITDLCKGRVGIYLDLKDVSVDKLVSIVKKWDMVRQVLWYADDLKLERVAELCPECIVMPDPGPEKNLLKVIERFQPLVIAAVWRYYSESFIAKCHRAGAIVIVDESTPACWEDAIAWNSDGIQTDYPEQPIAFLKLRQRQLTTKGSR